jgi:hypothetical protein
MTSYDELQKDGKKSPRYCSQFTHSELNASIEEYHNRCLVADKIIYYNGAQIQSSFIVHKQELEDGTNYIITSGKYFVSSVFSYKKPTSVCRTEIVVTSNKKDASENSAAFSPYKKISGGFKPSCWVN